MTLSWKIAVEFLTVWYESEKERIQYSPDSFGSGQANDIG